MGCNMIYVSLEGRCGNQLFAYAFARRLQIEYNDEITMIYQMEKKSDPTFANVLNEFCTVPFNVVNYQKNIIKRYGNLVQKTVFILYEFICKLPVKERVNFYERQTKCQNILYKEGIYWLIRGYSKPRLTRYKNKFIQGCFEDKRYFDDIKNLLRKELRPTYPIEGKNIELYNIIKNTESVCVSIRRGDFLQEENKGLRDICSYEYYLQGIELIKQRIKNPVFIIFSDDIQWIKYNYSFTGNVYYEDGNDRIAEKMRLMYSCKHFIMSNSTFCWWAQYLSENKDKIVVSPSKWFNLPGYVHSLIDNEWVLINVN